MDELDQCGGIPVDRMHHGTQIKPMHLHWREREAPAPTHKSARHHRGMGDPPVVGMPQPRYRHKENVSVAVGYFVPPAQGEGWCRRRPNDAEGHA
jgi:hypothetical protein